MGLDFIELVFAVEDAFGLFIPNEDAETFVTPRVMVDYLAARLTPGASVACLSQRAFYRLRRAGMQTLQQPRNAFRPEVPWSALLHPDRRRRQWDLLETTVGVQPWPRAPLFWRFGETPTVGDTARFLATSAPMALRAPNEGWTRQQIEEAVTALVQRELGVATVRLDDRFVEDLGCG